MSNALVAALGAVAGAFVTAVTSVLVSYYQRQSALSNEHQLRAFETHLPDYERIFVAARSAQDALHDYIAIRRAASEDSDPFIRQLLDILNEHAYHYCVTVDWRHNAGMAYLDLKLEERCLAVRDLFLTWLSRKRVGTGDLALVRTDGYWEPIPLNQIQALRPGDYHELRIESRTVVLEHADDPRLLTRLDGSLSDLIVKLKAVMAF